jgi:adenylate kinase
MPKPDNRVFVIMGAPNAGKGTQGKLLGDRLGAVYFSTGELMRAENRPDVMSVTNTGALAPNDYIRDLIARALRDVPENQPIVIDGAKMLPEAEWLVDYLPSLGRKLNHVVLINITEAESRKRSMAREHGREDDAAHVQDVRWERFNKDVRPTIAFYKSIGLLSTVEGTGEPREVAERVWKVCNSSYS